MKKKLEADINELEIALDHANKANAEAQKNIKRYQQQLKDVQTALEEEQRARDEARELLGISERRANALQNELEESRTLLEQADRGRRQAEQELADCHEQLNELGAQNASISAAKRKLEAELQTLHVSIILLLFSLSLSLASPSSTFTTFVSFQSDLDELLNEAKNSEEKAKKAMVDAARLADELRAEQDHAQTQEKLRKALETQIKELQVRLDEAEANALKGGKKAIQKLEQRVRELENELDGEQRRHADAQKNLRKSERRIKELSFQVSIYTMIDPLFIGIVAFHLCKTFYRPTKIARTTSVCKIWSTSCSRRSRRTRGRSKKRKRSPL